MNHPDLHPPTRQDVRAALAATENPAAILRAFGVKSVDDLQPRDFPKVIAAAANAVAETRTPPTRHGAKPINVAQHYGRWNEGVK